MTEIFTTFRSALSRQLLKSGGKNIYTTHTAKIEALHIAHTIYVLRSTMRFLHRHGLFPYTGLSGRSL